MTHERIHHQQCDRHRYELSNTETSSMTRSVRVHGCCSRYCKLCHVVRDSWTHTQHVCHHVPFIERVTMHGLCHRARDV